MAFQKQLKFDNGTIAQTFPAIISLAPNSAIKHHSLMDLPATHFSVHSNLRLPSRISDPKQPISPIGPPPCFHFGPPRPIFLPLFVLLSGTPHRRRRPPTGRSQPPTVRCQQISGYPARRQCPQAKTAPGRPQWKPWVDRRGSLGFLGGLVSSSCLL